MLDKFLGRLGIELPFAVGHSETRGDLRFATVLVRTTPDRFHHLERCLASLHAQTDQDFQTVVLVHNLQGREVEPDSVAAGHEDVRVVVVEGGERGRPLNVGLDLATSRYVMFLDDDDLALPDWVATFRAGARKAGTQIIRSLTIHRPVRLTSTTEVEATGPDRLPEGSERFDLLTIFTRSRTPICSVAVPLAPLSALSLRFSDDLEALEDFHFLIRAASLLGVHETGKITSVYHRWEGTAATVHHLGPERWEQLRQEVFERLDEDPLLLPRGSVSRLVELHEQVAESHQLRREVKQLERRIKMMETSTSWRATAPLRAIRERMSRER